MKVDYMKKSPWKRIEVKDRTVIQRYLPVRIKTTLAAHREALKTNG